MLESNVQPGGAKAEINYTIPEAGVEFVSATADVLFSKIDPGISYIKAKVASVYANPDSQNQKFLEILNAIDTPILISNKSFSEIPIITQDISNLDIGVNRSEVPSAIDVFNRTVTFNRNYDDTASAVSSSRLLAEGQPINSFVLNGAALGWEFLGSGELVKFINKNVSETAVYSEAIDHVVNKNLNEPVIPNDSTSITLAKDSTIVSEGFATDEILPALQTSFVFNDAVLNERPIN